MSLLKKGDAVGLIACSNGRPIEAKTQLEELEKTLIQLGLQPKFADTIYCVDNGPFSGTPQKRGNELMKLFADQEVKAIFDISGGDAANQVLPYLDFKEISKIQKPFVGLSDLSVINNAIVACSKIPAYHYQISNLIKQDKQNQLKLFQDVFFSSHSDMNSFKTFSYKWLRGEKMEGEIIGGNTRCFLKLAGTKYFPDPTNKIIFLESLGGGPATLMSLFTQLEQMRCFEKCSGILLGTFTEMEAKGSVPSVEELLLEVTKTYHMPVAKTSFLGHRPDAHCLPLGIKMMFH
ncbi:S66 family peptidase [Niallia sp. 03133]|uniref:S66 family peptidase n=1 Tax=Niallia sp. 03133 TaxID=3458060 RepID=UPI004044A74F